MPSVVAWGGIYAAGIHPTIAGVIVGLMTPVRAWLGPVGFVSGVRGELEHLAQDHSTLSSHELAKTLRHVDAARREAMSPAESLIEALHPWVAFGCHAGLRSRERGRHGIGIGWRLELWPSLWPSRSGSSSGKPLGVLVATGLALRFGVGTLPVGLTARHLVVLGSGRGCGLHDGAVHCAARIHGSERCCQRQRLAC